VDRDLLSKPIREGVCSMAQQRTHPSGVKFYSAATYVCVMHGMFRKNSFSNDRFKVFYILVFESGEG